MSSGLTATRSAWVVGVVAITALSLVLHAPSLADGPTLDAAVFTVIADGLRRGDLPYRDLWDHKPPGIYVLFATAQTLLPFVDPWTAVWAFSVAVTAGIGVVVMFLTARPGSAPAVFWALVAVLYAGIYPIALGGGQTEPAAALLAILSLAAALSGRAALAGLLIGAGVMVSFQVASAEVAILAAVALAVRPGRPGPAIARYASGALVAPGLTVTAVLALGIAESAVSAVVTYNATYAAVNRSRPIAPTFGVDALLILFLATPLLVLALPTAARALRRFEDPLTAASALWFAGWAVLVGVQFRLEPHYFVAAVPPLVLLAAHGRFTRVASSRTGLVTAALLVATSMTLASAGLVPLASRISGSHNDVPVKAVAAALRRGAPAGGSLFVWGNEPELYLASGLRPATPYVYVYPLMTPGFVDEARIQDLVRDLQNSRPTFVVDAGSAAPGQPGIVPLLVPRPVPEVEGRTTDVIEPLRSFVREHYGPPVQVGGWLVYPATDW